MFDVEREAPDGVVWNDQECARVRHKLGGEQPRRKIRSIGPEPTRMSAGAPAPSKRERVAIIGMEVAEWPWEAGSVDSESIPTDRRS
jgi:hypothetical protein